VELFTALSFLKQPSMAQTLTYIHETKCPSASRPSPSASARSREAARWLPLIPALSRELSLSWVSARNPGNRARSCDHATTKGSTCRCAPRRAIASERGRQGPWGRRHAVHRLCPTPRVLTSTYGRACRDPLRWATPEERRELLDSEHLAALYFGELARRGLGGLRHRSASTTSSTPRHSKPSPWYLPCTMVTR